MSDEALHAAFARLESAIDRIERAARGRVAAAQSRTQDYALLDERHTLLRARVSDAIGRLDALIGVEAG